MYIVSSGDSIRILVLYFRVDQLVSNLLVLCILPIIILQTERSFQKQPTIFLNRKKGLGAKKRKSLRYTRNIGLGFKTPREVGILACHFYASNIFFCFIVQQTEKSFQKQPRLNLNLKLGSKKKVLRRHRSVGLGFKTPREVCVLIYRETGAGSWQLGGVGAYNCLLFKCVLNFICRVHVSVLG